MRYTFNLVVAVQSVENAYAVVAFGDSADVPGRELFIGREVDDDGRAAGEDGCGVWTETGAISYEGVAAWRFDDTGLLLTIAPEAADVLDVAHDMAIALDQDTIERLQPAIEWLFEPDGPLPAEAFTMVE